MAKLESAKVGQQKEKDFDAIEARFDFLDMEKKKMEHWVMLAKQAYKKLYDSEITYFKDMAEIIKDELDRSYPGSWHIIVGTHFGSFCSYEVKWIWLFWLEHIGFLIFKHG